MGLRHAYVLRAPPARVTASTWPPPFEVSDELWSTLRTVALYQGITVDELAQRLIDQAAAEGRLRPGHFLPKPPLGKPV